MAQTVTLEGLRSQIATSIFGRRLGFDSDNMVCGPKAVRRPIVALTSASTVADQIPNYGIATIAVNTTVGSTWWNPVSPAPGASVKVFNISTGYAVIWLNGSTATTAVTGVCAGSSVGGASTATLSVTLNRGHWAELDGISTAVWFVRTNIGSTVTTGSSMAI
jgi:hypothetical protein